MSGRGIMLEGMKATFPAIGPGELRRLILNQKEEHTPHAFRGGATGMADFRRVAPALSVMTPGELEPWLDLIEEVAATHRGCLPCSAKLWAYLMVFSRDKLPDRHVSYLRRYRQHARLGADLGRNFLREVLESLQGNDDSPAAEAHRRSWRAYVIELQVEERGDRE